MFAPILPLPAPDHHVPTAWEAYDPQDERQCWSADRLLSLPIPGESLALCREMLVQNCRDCPDFREAVNEVIQAGPTEIAAMAGLLHEERFGQMLQDLAATAQACGMGQAVDLRMIPRTVDVADNPLRSIVKRLSKRANLRDADGFTLPLIVGRSLVDWTKVCTKAA
ncbi:hypothetical protein [Alienimonas sp. DA493]|uniref:hypothetical protein n=1 Tax=Alienimonas sp. DA493 TaxID=3373605 RepID=UPI003754B796